MNRSIQEFFWTPTDTIRWLKVEVLSLRLWIVMWPVGSDARPLHVAELELGMFENDTEDAVQIFLGSAALSGAPEWTEAGGRRLLDFERSYAVQFAPSLITPDRKILLQGRMAMLRRYQYEDYSKATKLSELFRRLRASMKQASDRSRVVVQVLSKARRSTGRAC